MQPTLERVIKNLFAVGVLLGGLTLGLPAKAASSAAAPSQDFQFSVDDAHGLLDLSYHSGRVLRYAYATNQYKPYVRELYSLKGDNVLLDAPPDHLHHHGLMYAIRVNGINFWEERDDPGYEKPVRLLERRTGHSGSGAAQAMFSQVIHWVSRTNGLLADTAPVALLVEKRVITVTIDESQQELALTWHSAFEVGEGARKVTLTGSSYHGLGLRLPAAFNRVARHRNSEGLPYPTNGKGDVTVARWSVVSNGEGANALTIAMFGRPAPDRGLPAFFTMVEPFTYLSVTQGLDKSPSEHVAGDRFELDYLLLVYADQRTPEFLEGRYQRWSRQ